MDEHLNSYINMGKVLLNNDTNISLIPIHS